MNYKHGYTYYPLYRIWQEMKDKCFNKNNHAYKYYGGRGIIVCDEWMNPEIFIGWALSNEWKRGLYLDRRNNNGNYCLENCRFITPKESAHNQRLLRSDNISGYRGVHYHIRDKKWIANIMIDNKLKHVGSFNSPELAALAYDKAVPDNRPRNFK